MRTITQLVIHHTAGASGTIAEFTREHQARGFSTIGYHKVIGNGKGIPEGMVEQGRPDYQEGAGVFRNNTGKLHVSLVGNFEEADSGYTGPPSAKQLWALGHVLLLWGKAYHPSGERGHAVVGHKEITVPGHGTVCPGSKMPLDRIREWYRESLPDFESTGKAVQSLDVYLKSQ